MIEIDLHEPPAIVELRNDATAIARLRLYGDDCVLMGWTGAYKSDAPVSAFLTKAETLRVDRARAVTMLLEHADIELNHWHWTFASQNLEKLAEFLSVSCPELATRFPEVLVADGDVPTTPDQFHAKLLSFRVILG